MGLLRVLLAVAVLVAHTSPVAGLTLTGSLIAVQTFYIISGFYMALILTEKYTGKGAYRLFVTNRLLKIVPVYWVILGATLAYSLARLAAGGGGAFLEPYLDYGGELKPGSWLFLVATNLVVFGQDLAMFLGLHDGGLAFTTDYTRSSPLVYPFLLVPQAWTLGVELTFYLIAPFLVRRGTVALAVVAATSFAWRVWNYRALGLDHDPWTYRFFPTELFFFVVGILSYRLYLVVRDRPLPRALPAAATALLFLLSLGYQFLPGNVLKQWAYYALVGLLLPLLFLATRSLKWDRSIGELSYPIYLCHVLVAALVSALSGGAIRGGAFGLVTLVFSVMLSILLVRFVAYPLETVRQARARRGWRVPKETGEIASAVEAGPGAKSVVAGG
jgi:peptidoglycan/LPS O-acetylase OafA/YrhL